MESLEQRNNKKLIAIIVAVIVVIGAFIVYKSGIIPGLGAGNKTAQELKTEIENLRGKNLVIKYLQVMGQFFPMGMMPAADKDTLNEQMNKMAAATDFSFSSLETKAEGNTGIVEINSPIIKQGVTGSVMGGTEYHYPKITVAKTADHPNHYRLDIPGSIEMFSQIAEQKQKLFAVASDTYTTEFTLENNKISDLKSNAKNMNFIEGRGNTTLFKISEMNLDFYSHSTETSADSGLKLSLNNLIPGDMIKLMLGAIEPISLNIDYTYKGENIGPALLDLVTYPDRQAAEEQKVVNDPNYKPQNLPEPAVKPFDGELKLNNFSLLMGNAGLTATANLQFKKAAKEPIPVGEITLKIAQYQKLIDYVKKFMPVPQEQTANAIKFFSEIGENANGNITIIVKFDGTENILVGNKTTDQIEALTDRYYPPKPQEPTISIPMPAPPEPVEAKPIKNP